MVVTYPDELLEVATARMLEHDIGHLPVVSRADPGRLVGHIDRAAVMTAWAHASREEGGREAQSVERRPPGAGLRCVCIRQARRPGVRQELMAGAVVQRQISLIGTPMERNMRANRAVVVLLLMTGISAPRLAGQNARAIHPAVGLGRLVSDDVHGALGRAGFAAYGRLTWWKAGGVSLLVDGWFHSVSTNHDIVTAPCPPSTPCGSPSFTGGTTALVLAPALQAREGYERVALLYRIGPSVAWFAHRAPSTDAAALGVRGGFSVLTSHGASGVLLSVDYLRVFRDNGGPRWFLPITIGWQF